MSKFGIRHSKFKHIFGERYRRDLCYDAIRIAKNAFDSSYCAVNSKFVAVILYSAGGGAFLVLPINQTGRVDAKCPRVIGHKGPVLDIAWNPFDDGIIASASEDHDIRLWSIPDGGIPSVVKKDGDSEEVAQELSESLMILSGHTRRVTLISWHPTASDILASSSHDLTVIIWNTKEGEAINKIKCHKAPLFCMVFNYNGSLLATTSKDRKLRVIDPRSTEVHREGMCHSGLKGARVVFTGESNRLITTGFSRMSERQFAIWDPDNLDKPLKMEVVDCGTGILFPFYDNDTKVLYLAGRGDGNIRFYELVEDPPYFYYLDQYKSSFPQQGLTYMPKRYLDVQKCEIFRFYKLYSRGYLEPLSMIVPRKYNNVQTDLYPPTYAGIPSLTASDWLSGIDKCPVLQSITEDAVAEFRSRIRSIKSSSPSSTKKIFFSARESNDDGLSSMTKEQLVTTCKSQKQEIDRLKKELSLLKDELKILKKQS